MQERKEEALEVYNDERLTEFAKGEAVLGRHLKFKKKKKWSQIKNQYQEHYAGY